MIGIAVGMRIEDNDPRQVGPRRTGEVTCIANEESVWVKWSPSGRETKVKKSRIRPRDKARTNDYILLEDNR